MHKSEINEKLQQVFRENFDDSKDYSTLANKDGFLKSVRNLLN